MLTRERRCGCRGCAECAGLHRHCLAALRERFPIFCPTRFWTSQQARKLSEVLERLLRDPGDLEDGRLDQLSNLKDAFNYVDQNP